MLYFNAADGSRGPELWRSNGTAAGTLLVKDINPGSQGSNPSGLINMGGTLYFSASDGGNGFELWRSDGTEVGTTLVKNINPAPFGSSAPRDLTNVNGTLYFSAFDGGNGKELWRSDGRRHRPGQRHSARSGFPVCRGTDQCERHAFLQSFGARHAAKTTK